MSLPNIFEYAGVINECMRMPRLATLVSGNMCPRVQPYVVQVRAASHFVALNLIRKDHHAQTAEKRSGRLLSCSVRFNALQRDVRVVHETRGS